MVTVSSNIAGSILIDLLSYLVTAVSSAVHALMLLGRFFYSFNNRSFVLVCFRSCVLLNLGYEAAIIVTPMLSEGVLWGRGRACKLLAD